MDKQMDELESPSTKKETMNAVWEHNPISHALQKLEQK